LLNEFISVPLFPELLLFIYKLIGSKLTGRWLEQITGESRKLLIGKSITNPNFAILLESFTFLRSNRKSKKY
jgi:hypothetical protein